MNLIDFLHNKFRTLTVHLPILRVSEEHVELCDQSGRTQIRLLREDYSVEYVSDQLNQQIVEEIVAEILSQYHSAKRIQTLSKSLYK